MRKADIYQKIYWGDILKRTMHLHGYERGPYLMLLACYFLRGGPLPDDDARFATITALSLEQWRAMRPLLEPFFDIRGGLWRHEGVEEEIRTAEADWEAKSRGARITNARRTAERPAERPAQRPQSQLESELEQEEECLRRTRALVGPAQPAGHSICWRTLYRECPPAYRHALAQAESRKKEPALGLPQAQIKDWALYLLCDFKIIKAAYEKPDNAEAFKLVGDEVTSL